MKTERGDGYENHLLSKTGCLVLMDGYHPSFISPVKPSSILTLHKTDDPTDTS